MEETAAEGQEEESTSPAELSACLIPALLETVRQEAREARAPGLPRAPLTASREFQADTEAEEEQAESTRPRWDPQEMAAMLAVAAPAETAETAEREATAVRAGMAAMAWAAASLSRRVF